MNKRIISILLSITVLLPSFRAYADGFTLPESLQIIEEESFMDTTSIGDVELPEGITTIEGNAFKDSSVTSVNLPESLINIVDTAFDGLNDIGFNVKKHSYAYRWAKRLFKRLLGFDRVVDLAERDERFHFSGETYEEDNSEERMAHNIYSDPDLTGTSGRYTAFSIDFLAEDTAEFTYWSLCNWSMDLSELVRSGNTITNDIHIANKEDVGDAGGAYVGLQNKGSDGYTTVSIMSFWDTFYKDKNGTEHILEAHRIYPVGEEQRFAGEGKGSNYIDPYPWETDHWYRMLIRCVETPLGKTLVEEWIMDLEHTENGWDLRSCFDTGLMHSCFTGNMSQFMENWSYQTSNNLRSVRFKNIFVMEEGSSSWTAITSSTLSTDTQWNNKKGNYAFGSNGDTLWGITNGTGPDVTKGSNHGPISEVFSFTSSDIPTMPDYNTGEYEARDTYTIASALNPSYVLYGGYGTVSGGYPNVVLWEDYEGVADKEQFEFVQYGGMWKIVHVASGMLLTAGGTGMNNSTVHLDKQWGDSPQWVTQLWYLYPQDDGTYLIKSNSSYDTYLDVTNAVAANGTDIQVHYRNSAYLAQNWYFR